MSPTLAINELYDALTVQGEGPSLGRLCTFVRLARCNLDCGEGDGAMWSCDTPFTWRWAGIYSEDSGPVYSPAAEITTMPVAAVVEHVLTLAPPLVVISGGEPMLQRAGLTALVDELWEHGIDVEIETNGTQRPWDGLGKVTAYNVSPKLANSGVARDRAWKPEVLSALLSTGRARFKFVCSQAADLDEVAELCCLANIPAEKVWVMPAGTSTVQIRQSLARVADAAIARRWNVTTRLHIALWNSKRGV